MRERIIIAIFAMFLLPIGAWGQDEDYSIVINLGTDDDFSQIFITSDNANDILGDGGTMKYNAEKKVLTLEGANLTCSMADFAIIDHREYWSYDRVITVHLIGDNTITLGNDSRVFDGTSITFTAEDENSWLTIKTQDGWTGHLFDDGSGTEISATYNDHLFLDDDVYDNEKEYIIQRLYLLAPYTYTGNEYMMFRFGYQTGNNNEVIHYSIDYVDDTLNDVTDAVFEISGKGTSSYEDDLPLYGPCTMTYYSTAGGGQSEVGTAYYFGLATNSVTTPLGIPVAPPIAVPALEGDVELTITETMSPPSGVNPIYNQKTGLISTSATGETICSVELDYYEASNRNIIVLNETEGEKYQLGTFTLTVTDAEEYDLWIYGELVTSENAGNITSGVEEGTVTFAVTDEPSTGGQIYTLTLNNATISQYQSVDAILFKYPKLTVHLIGENHIENGFVYWGTDAATGTVEFTSDGGEENCLIFNNASSPDDLVYGNTIYTTGFYNCTYNTISEETGWTFKQTDDGKLKLYRKTAIDYGISIGDIAVTSDNASDILGDGYATQGSTASFQYFPDLNKLFITNNTDGLKIETNNDEGLTIYLAPNSTNAIGRIVYGGKSNAPLTITTDGNYPGNITLSANSNVISGFSSLTLEQNLVVMDPEDLAYDTNNWCLATTTATIGVPLTPITEEKTIKPDGNELKPEAGSSDINKVVDDILYTLGNTDDSNNGDGYDDGGFVVINSITSDQQAMDVSKNSTPGTDEYLEGFKGLTFMVPAGNGDILFDMETPDGFAMKVMVGDAAPVAAKKQERGILKIPYNVAEPTYVYVWNGGQTSDASTARGIQKGKMTTVHIKVYTVGTKPNKVKPSNPAAEASGGEYQGDVIGLEGQDIETDAEIEASKGDVNGDETANVADIVGIVNAICGSHSATFDKRAADANGDTVVDATDIVIIVNKIIGK